jgi:hypothetical protein
MVRVCDYICRASSRVNVELVSNIQENTCVSFVMGWSDECDINPRWWRQRQSPSMGWSTSCEFTTASPTCAGQENRNNGRGDPLRWPRDTLYPQNLALTSPTSGGHSVGIVRLRTKRHGGVQHVFKVFCSFYGSRRSGLHPKPDNSTSHISIIIL